MWEKRMWKLMNYLQERFTKIQPVFYRVLISKYLMVCDGKFTKKREHEDTNQNNCLCMLVEHHTNNSMHSPIILFFLFHFVLYYFYYFYYFYLYFLLFFVFFNFSTY